MPKILFAWLVLLATTSPAQAGIFDNPENLKVLPADTTAAELRDTMRGFAFATGSRCHTCHVGEPGQPLTSFDFASDKKANKRTARAMLRMVQDINLRLARELGDDAAPTLQVECVTCHRGQARPVQLADELAQTLDRQGLDAATARYGELKDQYYGSHTFDFSEWSLLALAERLVQRDDSAAALAFLTLNLQTNPASVASLLMQAQLHVRDGHHAQAKTSLERALKIDPTNAFIEKQLRALDGN